MKSMTTFPNIVPTEEIEWVDITGLKRAMIAEDEIYVSYIRSPSDASTKPLLCFRFGAKIIEHMKFNIKTDRIAVHHNKHDYHDFLLLNASSGYKVSKNPDNHVHQISFRYRQSGMSQFKSTLVTAFFNKNGTIRLRLPDVEPINLDE